MTLTTYRYYQPAPGSDPLRPLNNIVTPPYAGPYVLVYVGCVEADTDYRTAFEDDEREQMRMAEAVWSENNADDRPRDNEVRSMCVGDVLALTNEDFGTVWLQASAYGFWFIDPPLIEADAALVRGRVVPIDETCRACQCELDASPDCPNCATPNGKIECDRCKEYHYEQDRCDPETLAMIDEGLFDQAMSWKSDRY